MRVQSYMQHFCKVENNGNNFGEYEAFTQSTLCLQHQSHNTNLTNSTATTHPPSTPSGSMDVVHTWHPPAGYTSSLAGDLLSERIDLTAFIHAASS